MMKLEQIVTSLELAKKLDEAGVRIDSVFVWIHGYKLVQRSQMCNCESCVDRTDYTSAPTASELMEKLPAEIHFCHLNIRKGSHIEAGYYSSEECDLCYFSADTPANALAELLLWVVEQEGDYGTKTMQSFVKEAEENPDKLLKEIEELERAIEQEADNETD